MHQSFLYTVLQQRDACLLAGFAGGVVPDACLHLTDVGAVPVLAESLFSCFAYSRGIPAFAQAARVASSQTLACTSPMWALPSSSMHRRLWPMPPPMV